MKSNEREIMKNYVKKYKDHKVPEGATHWLVNGFAKWVDNKSISVIGCFQGATWKKCSHGMLANAIELPEAEQEWVPTHELINSTLYAFKGTPVKLHSKVINRSGAEVSIIELLGGDIYGVYNRYLTKIKTQEQKDREEFIDKSLSMWNEDCISPSDLVEKMFDHGARFTEVDK